MSLRYSENENHRDAASPDPMVIRNALVLGTELSVSR